MKNSTTSGNRFGKILISIAFWLLLWQVLSLSVGQKLLLCSPVEAAIKLVELAVLKEFWFAILLSLGRIVLGFVIMLGAAGSADTSGISFINVLLFELLGAAIILLGISALMHYKRYLRRKLLKKRLAKSNLFCNKRPAGTKICLANKELC